MGNSWFLGQGVTVTATFLDGNGNPFTPSPAPTVVVTDPTGTACTVGAPSAVSTGIYQAQVAPAVLAGVYTVAWTGNAGSVPNVVMYTFEVLNTAPLVSWTELQTYVGSTVEPTRGTLILNLAQMLCMSIVDPLPGGAEAVVMDVAVRAYSNPANLDSQNAGPYPVNYGTVSGGLWLTAKNISTLRLLAGGGGAFTFSTMPSTAAQNLPVWDLNVTPPYGDWDVIP